MHCTFLYFCRFQEESSSASAIISTDHSIFSIELKIIDWDDCYRLNDLIFQRHEGDNRFPNNKIATADVHEFFLNIIRNDLGIQNDDNIPAFTL